MISGHEVYTNVDKPKRTKVTMKAWKQLNYDYETGKRDSSANLTAMGLDASVLTWRLVARTLIEVCEVMTLNL